MKKLFVMGLCLYLQMCRCSADSDVVDPESQNAPTEDQSGDSGYFSAIEPSELEKIEALVAANCPYGALKEPKNGYDKIAKLLAGFRTAEDRKIATSRVEYEEFIADQWRALERASLSPVGSWAQEYIGPFVENGDVLFYPFGGPDVAYPIKFFPTVREYVLLGLEPIGSLEGINKGFREEIFYIALRRAVNNYLGKGFFITSEMSSQFSDRNRVNGVVCLILLELAKLGFDIDNVERISIDKKGLERPAGKNMVGCVKITFSGNGDASPRRIYYMRANLHNSSVNAVNTVRNFMKRRRVVTLVKSASYAMHDSSFSRIRDLILNDSQLLLQDDSGIPFCYFGDRWEKFIFGEYTTPTLKTFQKNRQQDLADYYASHEKFRIPFKIGYGFNQERPNLLLAVSPQRQKGPPSVAETSTNESMKSGENDVSGRNLLRSDGLIDSSSTPSPPPIEDRFLPTL
ncbi:MAG: hypothetical protein LBB63_01900 [Holosporaceae bacterium]|nr:hypothetical protein [Holosporaceae bacterium]